MSNGTENKDGATGKTGAAGDATGTAKDSVDERIERERLYQEALKQRQAESGASDAKTDGENDPNRITVDRSYIHTLREESKTYRKQLEGLKEDMTNLQATIKSNFGVSSIQDLVEKNRQEREAKEQEENSKLSRVELAEKERALATKQLEEEKIKWEQERGSLVRQRDNTIIETALIQEAVKQKAANPKQVLKLLRDEFYVDHKTLKPMYKAEDGELSLEKRVQIFLEDQDNWNLVMTRMPEGSGTVGTQGGPSSGPTFTKEELSELRRTNPKKYKEMNDKILKAYADKRVR